MYLQSSIAFVLILFSLLAEAADSNLCRDQMNMTPIDFSKISDQDIEIRNQIAKLVVGQDEGVNAIYEAYRLSKSKLRPKGRPIQSLLFAGPTGSGKTQTVMAAAKAVFGSEAAMVKIDCAEFQHSHEIAKLIGSPPGYLGHGETHPVLSQSVLNQHHTENEKFTFVLFDEIEKASDSMWNLLLGILDKATLTLGDNKRVDFSNTIIVMTSNLGARDAQALLDSKLKPGIGFMQKQVKETGRKETYVNAIKSKFSPEFYNRLDGVVVFNDFSEDMAKSVLDIQVDLINEELLKEQELQSFIELSPRAKSFLLEQAEWQKYNGRAIIRQVQKYLTKKVALLEKGKMLTHRKYYIDVNKGGTDLDFWPSELALIE